MAYPESSSVVAGNRVLATQYNNLRSDALYAETELLKVCDGTAAVALLLKPGTTILAPLVFTSGSLLTVPQAGAMEFDGTGIYLTPTNHRRFISLASDSIITTQTATTVASTTLWTGVTNANELKAQRVYTLLGCGLINNQNASSTVTITINFGATAICALTTPGSKLTNQPWQFNSYITIRSIGDISTGVVSSHGVMTVSTTIVHSTTEAVPVDTTIANDITVKAAWSGANSDNWVKLTQCWMATAD